jgi:hypothetical protein
VKKNKKKEVRTVAVLQEEKKNSKIAQKAKNSQARSEWEEKNIISHEN